MLACFGVSCSSVRGRLAPSPTGVLHLGNARTFLLAWLSVRSAGGTLVLRIEDIDGPRLKPGAAELAMEDLRWLGLDWDEGPVFQSARLPRYTAAMQRLLSAGLAYPCVCSRKEVETAASAPHGLDGPRYPGTCRGRWRTAEEARHATGKEAALRFRVEPGVVAFDDGFHGSVSCDVAAESGDFVIAKRDGTPAYQLAVVVDDAEMQIDEVLRGDDLLPSTPRQILLYRALGLTPPKFVHVPLVVGEDGRRLAKRHGDTTLRCFRDAGVTPGRVIAWIARTCGLDLGHLELSARDLVGRLPLAEVPASPVVFRGSL
jgi:glutamyl-tRNA synthetase